MVAGGPGGKPPGVPPRPVHRGRPAGVEEHARRIQMERRAVFHPIDKVRAEGDGALIVGRDGAAVIQVEAAVNPQRRAAYGQLAAGVVSQMTREVAGAARNVERFAPMEAARSIMITTPRETIILAKAEKKLKSFAVVRAAGS